MNKGLGPGQLAPGPDPPGKAASRFAEPKTACELTSTKCGQKSNTHANQKRASVFGKTRNQRIKAIQHRPVLNSHVQFTTEFVIELQDGSAGVAASPQGETISIYEDKKTPLFPESVVGTIEADGLIGSELSQREWDGYLQDHIRQFGRNNAYSLSLAFHNATNGANSEAEPNGRPKPSLRAPLLCCNILNGGQHAYTNPVLSDFPEYLLVSKRNDIKATVLAHNEIQRVVKEQLARLPKTVICGNPVTVFAARDNRECIDFLQRICGQLGFTNDFDLMIDASAGDLWANGKYHFAITNQRDFSPESFRSFWNQTIADHGLRFLEDPFHEKDFDNWRKLTESQRQCRIIGDNLYCSDPKRIAEGAVGQLTHGVIIKPNQAGTVTTVRQALQAAQRHQQIVITSHRSISTEETFISTLSCLHGADYIKIGPLVTDYSSVLRLNEIIRLTT